MLTKKALIEALDGLPDDAVVVANDGAQFIPLGLPILVRQFEDKGGEMCWYGPKGEHFGEVENDLDHPDLADVQYLIVCDRPVPAGSVTETGKG